MPDNLQIILYKNVEILSIRLIFIFFYALFRMFIFTSNPYFIEKTFSQVLFIVFCEIFDSYRRLYNIIFIDKYTPENVKNSSEHQEIIYDITFSRISLTPGEVWESFRSDSIYGFMRDCEDSSTNS
jgi:hypothetical protein